MKLQYCTILKIVTVIWINLLLSSSIICAKDGVSMFLQITGNHLKNDGMS
jgi:hypothetical protein